MPTFLAKGNIKKYILEHQKKYFISSISSPDLYISKNGEPHTSKLSNGSFDLDFIKNIDITEDTYIIIFPRYMINGKIRTAYGNNISVDYPIYYDWYSYPRENKATHDLIKNLLNPEKIKFKYSFNRDIFFVIYASKKSNKYSFEFPMDISIEFYDILFNNFINPYFTGKQVISPNIGRIFLPRLKYQIGYKPDIQMSLPPIFTDSMYKDKTACFKTASKAYNDYTGDDNISMVYINNKLDIDFLIKRLAINNIIFLCIKCKGDKYESKKFIEKYKPVDNIFLIFYKDFTYLFFHAFNIFYYKNKYYLANSYFGVYNYQIFRSFENIGEVSEFLMKIDTLTKKIEDNTLQELNLILYCINSYNNYLLEKLVINENLKYKWEIEML